MRWPRRCARRRDRPAVRCRTGTRWLASTHPGTTPTSRAGILLVLGIALLYTGISLVNTTVMAASDRVRDLAALRLAGATRAQVLRLIGAESLTVVVVGAVLGLVVAGLELAGLGWALRLLSVPSTPDVPWTALTGIVVTCAALTVTTSLLTTTLSLRPRAVELSGVRE